MRPHLLCAAVAAFILGGCGGVATASGTAAPSAMAAPTLVPAQVLPVGCGDPNPDCQLTPGTWKLDGANSFIRGLTLTVPSAWTSAEQDAGEFKLSPASAPSDVMMMWRDVMPVTSDGTAKVIPGVPATPESLTAYFRGDRDFVVSPTTSTTIGDIPAITYVVAVSPSAQYTSAGCPSMPRCADLVIDPQHWDGAYGIGAPEVVRLYLAEVGAAADQHLLIIALDAGSETDLTAFTDLAARVIASIRLPAVIGS